MRWVGLDQYERLWDTKRWIVSIENLAIYGSLMLILVFVIGFLLAALIDQKIRFENTIRTVILYPLRDELRRHRPGLAVDPQPGVRHAEHRARLGWESFTFDPALRPTSPSSAS
jgi:glucose/mannose transport system permease protein